MIPRPPLCDGPDCEPRAAGWLHYPDCSTQTEDADLVDDMAAATALEDGVWRRPQVPQQRSAA